MTYPIPGIPKRHYPSRSQAIQAVVREKVERWNHTRLAEEVAKLNPKEERALAEERVAGYGMCPRNSAHES